MIAWLERAMPYAAVPLGDPLFTYEIRRVRWGQTAERLSAYSLKVLLGVQLLVLVLWRMFILASPRRTGYVAFDASGEFIGWLFLVGVGGNIVLDAVSVVAAVTSISGENSAGRWDLIRLSNCHAEQFVTAKYAVAQARTWRVMIVVAATRLGVPFAILLESLLPQPYSRLILFVYLSGYLAVYVLEPLWRMKAMSAVGMAIAARIRHATLALLAAFVVVASLWAMQALALGLLASAAAADTRFGIPLLLFLCGPVIAVPLWLVVRIFYTRLQTWAIEDATRHAFRPN